jgi:hypothetical protein
MQNNIQSRLKLDHIKIQDVGFKINESYFTDVTQHRNAILYTASAKGHYHNQ